MTAPLVRDFLQLTPGASIDAFIVRPKSEPATLAAQYALTSTVRPKLGNLLRDVRTGLAQNSDIGRFVYGSFGSGKSHFMRIVGMMLANDPVLYAESRERGIHELHAEHAWLADAALLVVPAAMIDADTTPGAFTRRIAQCFDLALEAAGKPPLRPFGARTAFEQFDVQCEHIPGYFAAFEEQTGFDRAYYDGLRARPKDDAETYAFARTIAKFVAGDERRFEPVESDVRVQMARHAKKLGYRGIVFLVDEFVLWAQGLTGEGYGEAVNALNALVESGDARELRFVVLVAIQRSITTTFPDDRSQKVLREQLERVQARFPEIRLEDTNLFEIAERRVLAPLPERADEWRRRTTEICKRLADQQSGILLGDEPAETLAKLYPFHPALLRVLSDVTQGLQRDRTALFLLNEILTIVRPDLEIGSVVSLATLWDALFAPDEVGLLRDRAEGAEANTHAHTLIKTYDTWIQLRPTIQQAAKNDAGAKTLDVVVKSVLLMQLSHGPFVDEFRGLDKAITIENIFRLNRSDLGTSIERVGVNRLYDLVMDLATAAPGVVGVEGTGPTAVVQVQLNAIDLSGLLESLHGGTQLRYGLLLGVVRDVLGFTTGFNGADGSLRLPWRGVDRRARVRLESTDQLSHSGKNSTFAAEPDDDAKLVVALEPEFGGDFEEARTNARAKLEGAREQAQSWAMLWLPGSLSADGREALATLVKVEVFRADPDAHLARFRRSDHGPVRNRIESLAHLARQRLATSVAHAYGEAARILTMRKEPPELFAPQNVDLPQRAKRFVTELLDRRYPQHPRFAGTPNASALNKLLAIYRRVLAKPTDNAMASDEAEIVARLGVPLELFEPGSAAVATLRTSGAYVDRVRELVVGGQRSVQTILRRLAEEPLGLDRPVAQLLIAVLAEREGYRIVVDKRPLVVASVGDVDPKGELSRAVVPSLADWNAARRSASELFGVTDAPSAHTIASVDALLAGTLPPISETLAQAGRCAAALRALEAAGRCGRDGVALRGYDALRLDLQQIDEASAIERLAAIDVAGRLPYVRAAAKDAPALEALRAFPYLAVACGDAELRRDLATTLDRGAVPIYPALASWRVRADAWITGQLEKTAAREPAGAARALDVAPTPPQPQPQPQSQSTSATPERAATESTARLTADGRPVALDAPTRREVEALVGRALGRRIVPDDEIEIVVRSSVADGTRP